MENKIQIHPTILGVQMANADGSPNLSLGGWSREEDLHPLRGNAPDHAAQSVRSNGDPAYRRA